MKAGRMNKDQVNLGVNSIASSFIPPPSSFSDWTLTAPGIHGESLPMRDLSREEVDFCIVGAGAGGGVLGAKIAEADLGDILTLAH